MTAVEWLIDRLEVNKIIPNPYPGEYWNILKRGALEMEKEQMLNAFQESRLTHPMIGFKHETFVDYYKQTFKLK